jgi:solute carrier family 25 S-adenosylmethionine transporter 26
MAGNLWSVFFASFIAGGFAGCAVDLALYPIDAIKTRLQANSGKRQVSWANIYSGLLSSMVASFPCAASFWVTYSIVKALVATTGLEPFPGFRHLVAAASSSVATAYIRSPFEVVKQHMQIGKHKSTLHVISNVFRAYGVRGFFVGALGMAARDVPFDILQFCIYEHLKFQDFGLPLQHLIFGALAGGVSAFVTTPLDVAKTKMVVESSRPEYSSISTALACIWKTEGVPGLFRAWQVRLLFTTIGGMIFFGTYEAVYNALYAVSAA